MDVNKKGVLINAAWGGWYAQGTDRLVRSMIYHGWNYDIKIWKDQVPNELFKPESPYTIKFSALMEAIRMGYTHILWMDCSLWVIKDPNILMEIIDSEGALFIKSGYNMAQTSRDKDLAMALNKIDRDYAETVPELWSCVFGFNLETEQGKDFLSWLKSFYLGGTFDTPRTHSGLCNDPRFLHARQDQTAISWAYHKSGYQCLMEPSEILSNYNVNDQANEKTIILMRGM